MKRWPLVARSVAVTSTVHDLVHCIVRYSRDHHYCKIDKENTQKSSRESHLTLLNWASVFFLESLSFVTTARREIWLKQEKLSAPDTLFWCTSFHRPNQSCKSHHYRNLVTFYVTISRNDGSSEVVVLQCYFEPLKHILVTEK